MKTADVEMLLRDTMARLTLNCCENHAHTVSRGCYSGDRGDVTIVKLCNVLITDRDVVKTWLGPVTRGWE